MNLAIERLQNSIAIKFLTQETDSACPWLTPSSPDALPLHVRSARFCEGVLLEQRWRSLEARSSCSFFLSWDWIGTWLKCHPNKNSIVVLEVYSGLALVGLALITEAKTLLHGLFPCRKWLLNESGSKGLDSICVERNGVLALEGFEEAATKAVLEYVLSRASAWDELCLSGISLSACKQLEHAIDSACSLTVDRLDPCPNIDLERLRSGKIDYLSALSQNTRSQIRRSIKHASAFGELSIQTASSTRQALQFLEELSSFHQSHWQAKGQPGAFADPLFQKFHDTLIRDTFDSGHIHLHRIMCGDRTLGILYNFYFGGCVYAYQSGFNYSHENLRPGILSHYRGVVYYLEQTRARQYDFLAGGSRYKRSLSTDEYGLAWCTLKRERLLLSIERQLRTYKRRLGAYFSR